MRAQQLIETDEDEEDLQLLDLLQPVFTVKYLLFRTGQGPFGSGGWSRNAKHRPKPELFTVKTSDVKFTGKSIFVNGVRRLKANVWHGAKPVRIDYPEIDFDAVKI